MKWMILLLVWTLSCNVLFSQVTKELARDILEGKQAGDTLTGKHVKYKLYVDNSGVYSVLQNLENRDTANLRLISPKRSVILAIPQCFKKQFVEIVSEFLTPSEWAVYEKAGGNIMIACRLKEGKIEELAFWYIRELPLPEDDSEMQDESGRVIVDKYKLLRQISVDRFFEMEKKLIERVDFSGQKWIEDGIYLKIIIDPCYMTQTDEAKFYTDLLIDKNEIYHVDTNIPGEKQVGDTLIGKHGKYKFYYYNNGGYLYLVMQNLLNRDTANLKIGNPKGMIHDFEVPSPIIRRFSEIVREFLTQEEREIYKQLIWCGNMNDCGALIIHCRLERRKIKELSFHFDSVRLEDIAKLARVSPLWAWAYFKKDNMLKQISVDRYHDIEQALIERIDFNGEQWIEDGKYLQVVIKSYYM